MNAGCLVDTSVFVQILDVPHMNAGRSEIVKELQRKFEQTHCLFLPLATIIETGNHIAQLGRGDQRRSCAEKFVKEVKLAIEGESPFIPIEPMDNDRLGKLLTKFPDAAARGMGLGDLSIQCDWERQCAKNEGRRVYIWSLDAHLMACDRQPTI